MTCTVENVRLVRRDNEFLHKIHLIQSFLPTLKAEHGRNLIDSDRFRFHCSDNMYGLITMYKSHHRIRLEMSLEFDDLLKLVAAIRAL